MTRAAASSPNPLLSGGGFAVLAAAAFGITTPLIQRVGRDVGAIPTAALLYAGAALASLDLLGRSSRREAPVRPRHFKRMALGAVLGAVVAPVCLAWGLQHTGATSASLLLNFEAIFTVILAWRMYDEAIGKRVALALVAMTAGGVLLVAAGDSGGSGVGLGTIAIVVATLGWALDSTLSRPLADLNPTQVVRWKATLGALLSLTLATAFKQPLPNWKTLLALLACGMLGYGLSLRFYFLAQRKVGAGRTGSIFALAPFLGAAAAWLMGDRTAGTWTLVSALLFAFGVYLQLTETHHHGHTHDLLTHEHAHRHDDGHHDHTHEPPVLGEHSHAHEHDDRTHEHPHGPDLHHRHRHG